MRSGPGSSYPGAGRRFEVQIAFDPIDDARATESSEPLIHAAADLTELRVGTVAQSEHREPGFLKPRCVVGEQRLIKVDGALRWIALAPGAGNQQQVRFFGELRWGGVGHVDDLDRESEFRRRLACACRQRLGIAGLVPNKTVSFARALGGAAGTAACGALAA